jgi:hypothetical protein
MRLTFPASIWIFAPLLILSTASGARSQIITEILDATGDGTNPFSNNYRIATDADGNVFATGWGTSNVFKITPEGTVTEIIDQSGAGWPDTLRIAHGVATDADGNVFVSGETSRNVFKITPGGTITEIIDESGDGNGNTLLGAGDLATDGDGNVFVSGYTSDNVFKITPDGTITEIIDGSGDGVNSFEGPRGISTDDDGNVYVAGQVSGNVFKITPGLSITEIIDATGDGDGKGVANPWDVAVDSGGNVYVACDFIYTVFKITPGNDITLFFNGVSIARALDVDDADNLYVAGYGSDNAFKVSPDGSATEIIDATGDGLGNELDAPRGIAVDSSGNVFVGGWNSDNVFKIAFPSELDLKVFLEGPYVPGGTLRTDVTSDLPVDQPFSEAPWNYAGSESVSPMPANVVDWLLVEYRSGTSAATVVAQEAVLLLDDGTVVDTSGTHPPQIPTAGVDSVYVVVRHRNHLDVMSAEKVAVTGVSTLDFTTSATAFGASAQKNVEGVTYALFAADANADGDVQALDFNAYLAQTTSGAIGYQSGDFNMDGVVQALDFNLYLANTLSGASSQVP